MRYLLVFPLAASVLAAACGTSASDEAPALEPSAAGTTTTITTTTTGANGTAKPRPGAAAPLAGATAIKPAAYREVTIPSGTTLQLSLNTAVASDTSRVEDAVSAELITAVVIGGRPVVPAGSMVAGVVTDAADSGRVKGRARIALGFTSLTTGGSRYALSTAPFLRLASATKGEDATKIGIGAGAGAIIGGILGGKEGAAQGAVVGGGAGTGVVLATKGQEVRLATGADVSTQLTAPLTILLAR